MDALTATIGAVRFRFSRLETDVIAPQFACEPFLILDDGTEVKLLERGRERYLLVDHRRDHSAAARIEFWEAMDAAEGGIAGLYAMCEAAHSGRASQQNAGPRQGATGAAPNQ